MNTLEFHISPSIEDEPALLNHPEYWNQKHSTTTFGNQGPRNPPESGVPEIGSENSFLKPVSETRLLKPVLANFPDPQSLLESRARAAETGNSFTLLTRLCPSLEAVKIRILLASG